MLRLNTKTPLIGFAFVVGIALTWQGIRNNSMLDTFLGGSLIYRALGWM